MPKRVYIIHGWEGSPAGNWFPWLKAELEKRGCAVTVPQMPNADHPKQAGWLTAMRDLIGSVDADTYLIGHSLGVIAVLRFLEQLPIGEKVGGAILVSGFAEYNDIPELKDFFQTSLDYGKVKAAALKIVVINSDNDPYVPFWQAEKMSAGLAAELVTVKSGGHLNAADSYFALPIVLEKFLAMSA